MKRLKISNLLPAPVKEIKMAEKTTEFLVGTVLYPELENEPFYLDDPIGESVEPHPLDWYLEKMVREEQGNLACIWSTIDTADKRPKTVRMWEAGGHLVKLLPWFRKHGLKMMTIYSHTHVDGIHLALEVVKKLRREGADVYLGENIGEYLNSWFNSATNKDCRRIKNLRDAKNAVVNDYLGGLAGHLKKMGYPQVFLTSDHSWSHYALEAGVDIPAIESMLCLTHGLAYAMSEMRGAVRRWDKPFWLSYFAHDWYTRHIPYLAKRKQDLLRTGLYLSWMNGSGGVILESGNFWTQAGNWTKDSERCSGYHSAVCRRYRKTMRDFYRFTREHERDPKGPLVRFCFALGNLDGFSGGRRAGNDDPEVRGDPVWGMTSKALEDNRYFGAEPEDGWEIMQSTVYPKNPQALSPYYNHYLEGAPFGAADVVGVDSRTPDELLAGYSLLAYTGWNTMEPEIYRKLITFVRRGGTLLMCIPHLSTRGDREYFNYGASDLINRGDVRELFDLEIIGRNRFLDGAKALNGAQDLNRWPDKTYPPEDLTQKTGFLPKSRKDLTCSCLTAKLELGREAEVLYKADTRGEFRLHTENKGEPLFIRRKLGKGCAYLVTCWDYPGAGGMRMLYAHILKHLILQLRDTQAHINDLGRNHPGRECANIFYTVYRETIYLLNTDCSRKHCFDLILDGRKRKMELKPAEFRIVRR